MGYGLIMWHLCPYILILCSVKTVWAVLLYITMAVVIMLVVICIVLRITNNIITTGHGDIEQCRPSILAEHGINMYETKIPHYQPIPHRISDLTWKTDNRRQVHSPNWQTRLFPSSYPLVVSPLIQYPYFIAGRVDVVQGSKSYSENKFIRLQVLSLIVTIYVLPEFPCLCLIIFPP